MAKTADENLHEWSYQQMDFDQPSVYDLLINQ